MFSLAQSTSLPTSLQCCLDMWKSEHLSRGFWFQSQFPMSSSPSSPCEWGTGPGPETPARHGADGEERPGPEEAWGAPASGSPVHVLTATVQTGRAWGRGEECRLELKVDLPLIGLQMGKLRNRDVGLAPWQAMEGIGCDRLTGDSLT